EIAVHVEAVPVETQGAPGPRARAVLGHRAPHARPLAGRPLRLPGLLREHEDGVALALHFTRLLASEHETARVPAAQAAGLPAIAMDADRLVPAATALAPPGRQEDDGGVPRRRHT